MRTGIGAACLMCWPLASFADQAKDLLTYAQCIGQGDAYAEAAAEYGYDAEARLKRNDARMADLIALNDAPPAATLIEARAKGRAEWIARADLMQTGGPAAKAASDAHVDNTVACQILRSRMRKAGLFD